MHGEERLIALARNILTSTLRTSSDDETIDMLTILENRLSTITDPSSSTDVLLPPPNPSSSLWKAAFHRFKYLAKTHNVVQFLMEDSTVVLDQYLGAIDELLRLTKDDRGRDRTVMQRTEAAVQVAMSRLEDEFRHILLKDAVTLKDDLLQFGSIGRLAVRRSVMEVKIVSGDLFEDRNAVTDLRNIAKRMIRAGYETECFGVYISARRAVFDDCLRNVLGVDKLSVEEVHNMKCRKLNDEINKWIRAFKLMAKLLLVTENHVLRHRIFPYQSDEPIINAVYAETTKASVMQMLNFPHSVVIARWWPEKLFRMLDMYKTLADALPALQSLLPSGAKVYEEAVDVWNALGEAAKATLKVMERAVKGDQPASKTPVKRTGRGIHPVAVARCYGDIHPFFTRFSFVLNEADPLAPVRGWEAREGSLKDLEKEVTREASSKRPIKGGDIHPMARYVMSYVEYLGDYRDTLNPLLEYDDAAAGDGNSSREMSPLARRIASLIDSLESKLEDEAALYKDIALQCVFLLNNQVYIVRKVRSYSLDQKVLLGDDWVRKRRGLAQRIAEYYLRISWSKPLSLLSREGIPNPPSTDAKAILMERIKSFVACFRDTCRIQSVWKVPDDEVRLELKLAIAAKVFDEYHGFLRTFRNHIETTEEYRKCLKYENDLYSYREYLFKGIPAGLMFFHHMS